MIVLCAYSKFSRVYVDECHLILIALLDFMEWPGGGLSK